MRKGAFTLIEVMVIIVIIGILGTLGFPVYQNFVDNTKLVVSQKNQEALLKAIDIYLMENDQVPADLSSIPPAILDRAYAQVLKEPGSWKVPLAYSILNFKFINEAYATYPPAHSTQDFLLNKIAKGQMKLLVDPSDRTPYGSCTNCVSYGLNSDLAGMTLPDYQALDGETVIIGDCDTATFTSLEDLAFNRHKEYLPLQPPVAFALVTTKGAKSKKKKPGSPALQVFQTSSATPPGQAGSPGSNRGGCDFLRKDDD